MIQNHGNAMIKNVLIHSYYCIFIQICIFIYCFASFLGTNVFWRIFVMKFINCLKALFWGGGGVNEFKWNCVYCCEKPNPS